MTLYVRETKIAPDDPLKADRLAAELEAAAAKGGVSVFAVEDEADIGKIAALYNAGRKYPKPFGYVLIPEEEIERHGEVASTPGKTPFAYLRDRHRDLRKLKDVGRLAATVVPSFKKVQQRDIEAAVDSERSALNYTNSEEWSDSPAGAWPRR